MRNIESNKILATFIFAMSIAGLCCPNTFADNSLLNAELTKSSVDSVNVTLLTSKPYSDKVSVSKRAGNEYVILMPETSNSMVTKPYVSNLSDMILSVDVKSNPAQNGNKGYTKITVKTTKPINITPKIRSLNPQAAISDSEASELISASKMLPVSTVSSQQKTIQTTATQNTQQNTQQSAPKTKTAPTYVQAKQDAILTAKAQAKVTEQKNSAVKVASKAQASAQASLSKRTEALKNASKQKLRNTTVEQQNTVTANNTTRKAVNNATDNLGITAQDFMPTRVKSKIADKSVKTEIAENTFTPKAVPQSQSAFEKMELPSIATLEPIKTNSKEPPPAELINDTFTDRNLTVQDIENMDKDNENPPNYLLPEPLYNLMYLWEDLNSNEIVGGFFRIINDNLFLLIMLALSIFLSRYFTARSMEKTAAKQSAKLNSKIKRLEYEAKKEMEQNIEINREVSFALKNIANKTTNPTDNSQSENSSDNPAQQQTQSHSGNVVQPVNKPVPLTGTPAIAETAQLNVVSANNVGQFTAPDIQPVQSTLPDVAASVSTAVMPSVKTQTTVAVLNTFETAANAQTVVKPDVVTRRPANTQVTFDYISKKNMERQKQIMSQQNSMTKSTGSLSFAQLAKNSRIIDNPDKDVKLAVSNQLDKCKFVIDAERSLYLEQCGSGSALVGNIKDKKFVLKRFKNPVNAPIKAKISERKANSSRYVTIVGNFRGVVEVTPNRIDLLVEL